MYHQVMNGTIVKLAIVPAVFKQKPQRLFDT